MNLIVDENIVFAKEAFAEFGNLKLVNGRTLTNTDIKDADVLIVRSITRVDEGLLKNSIVKFIGTATIGTDHIDLKYLEENNITFADAKGSNADSVAEYLFTALLKVVSNKGISLKGSTIGIVGVGNIGGRVFKLAKSMGMNVIKNDPPLERNGIGTNYVKLDEILKADIITLHVPFRDEGIDNTFHLLNRNNLKEIKNECIIVNTSRGAVIDNLALLKETNKKNFELILDVWENEPEINIDLLEKTKIGTQHIAGYSLEGKVNGTKMICDALCKYLNIIPVWHPKLSATKPDTLELPKGKSNEECLYKLFSTVYNIEKDDSDLRKLIRMKDKERAEYFDKLRKNYPVRREFYNYFVHLSKEDLRFKNILENFRFKLK
jgi:erythronate-4-phosphate dehydrogenase